MARTLAARSASFAGRRVTPGIFSPTTASYAAMRTDVLAHTALTSLVVLTVATRPAEASTWLHIPTSRASRKPSFDGANGARPRPGVFGRGVRLMLMSNRRTDARDLSSACSIGLRAFAPRPLCRCPIQKM